MSAYPGIERAAVEMAYCNNGVRRDRPECVVRECLDRFLASGADVAFELSAISTWLDALSDDQLQTVVDGEHSEVIALCADAPTGTDELLNEIFDNVI